MQERMNIMQDRAKKVANLYGERISECIEQDRALVSQAMKRWNGKWYGMGMGSHVGFRKWNEDGCRYPVRMYVEPFDKPRMVVSREDDDRILVKNYGICESMEIRDFLYPGSHQVNIEIANAGIGSFSCHIEAEPCKWLKMEMTDTEVESQEILRLICCPDKLPEKEEICKVRISDGDAVVELNVHGRKVATKHVPEMTFFEKDGVITILAEHFAKSSSNTIQILEAYGLCNSAVRALSSRDDSGCLAEPSLSYYVMAEKEGIYTAEIWTSPSNPVIPGDRLALAIRNTTSGEDWITAYTVPEGYQAGEPEDAYWSAGVIEQIHKTSVQTVLKKGLNEIELKFLNSISAVEKLIFYRKGVLPKDSCMGPLESWHK